MKYDVYLYNIQNHASMVKVPSVSYEQAIAIATEHWESSDLNDVMILEEGDNPFSDSGKTVTVMQYSRWAKERECCHMTQ